jgi:hypothetical protein
VEARRRWCHRGRLKPTRTCPSARMLSRSLAKGGRRMQRHNLSRPSLSLAGTWVAACRLKLVGKRPSQVAGDADPGSPQAGSYGVTVLRPYRLRDLQRAKRRSCETPDILRIRRESSPHRAEARMEASAMQSASCSSSCATTTVVLTEGSGCKRRLERAGCRRHDQHQRAPFAVAPCSVACTKRAPSLRNLGRRVPGLVARPRRPP